MSNVAHANASASAVSVTEASPRNASMTTVSYSVVVEPIRPQIIVGAVVGVLAVILALAIAVVAKICFRFVFAPSRGSCHVSGWVRGGSVSGWVSVCLYYWHSLQTSMSQHRLRVVLRSCDIETGARTSKKSTRIKWSPRTRRISTW